MLFDALLKGEVSVGAFAAVFASIGRMFGIFEEVFIRLKNNITNSIGKIHNFINLLDMPERGGKEIEPDFSKGISLNGVKFSYPYAEHAAVDGVTLTIKQGETVALVGENGSGKTTLVKILTGLYPPESSVPSNSRDIMVSSPSGKVPLSL